MKPDNSPTTQSTTARSEAKSDQAASIPGGQPGPTTYKRPADYVDSSRRRRVNPDAVSRGEMLLFRLIERLSRKGPGCVRTIEKIVEMLDKPSGGTYSERSIWRFWKTLVTLRWINYRIYRKRGRQYLEFWPLVRVEEPAERIFLRRKMAPSMAPSNADYGTLAPLPTDCIELSKGENDNDTSDTDAGSVVVPSPPAGEPDADPEALAALEEILKIPSKVAMKIAKGASPSKVRRASEAVREYLKRNAGNAIALVTVAIREGWNPPLAPSSQASDRQEKPVRAIAAPSSERVQYVRAPERSNLSQATPLPAVELTNVPDDFKAKLLARIRTSGAS